MGFEPTTCAYLATFLTSKKLDQKLSVIRERRSTAKPRRHYLTLVLSSKLVCEVPKYCYSYFICFNSSSLFLNLFWHSKQTGYCSLFPGFLTIVPFNFSMNNSWILLLQIVHFVISD